ncbi:hypothetical protein E2C01_079672 [Portunus trituberculatus]|uniref:Uncharacterized protein n=1 Tax=Portunus trituberculatus TaxID=210409 RepID=A0A5B7IRZ4_PORTR|nr:hypothetical protein [Portunus trituberculatus]
MSRVGGDPGHVTGQDLSLGLGLVSHVGCGGPICRPLNPHFNIILHRPVSHADQPRSSVSGHRKKYSYTCLVAFTNETVAPRG